MLDLAAAPFTSAEMAVDPLRGYPLAFAKLCRHIPPLFADSPPLCFLPYAPSVQQASKVCEFEALFPSTVAFEEKDPSLLKAHTDFLWTQLDHLGNAGFDPAKFRVDPFGNVLHRNGDPSSPLAWTVDHWFPQSRGGKTMVDNLQLVQWQVAQFKGQKLEFLIPWWELQLGISVNQFLFIFASKNRNFRQRAFSLLFPQGDGSNHSDLESHYWPQHFKQKAKQDGFAAAAIVKVRKKKEHFSGMDTHMLNVSGAPIGQPWRAEEEALLVALQKYRPVNWAERINLMEKENTSFQHNRSSDSGAEIECERELMARHTSTSSSLQQEMEVCETLSQKIQQTKDEVTQLEKELGVVKQHNEREKVGLQELEDILEKHKKRVEKQRRWSESQSHYRQCLERIIRDTLYQSSVFKEKARLNKAACTALLAKIQSHRMTCEDAEQDLAKHCKEREALEILAQPSLMEYICRCLVEQGFLNSGSTDASDKVLEVDNAFCEKHIHMDDKKCVLKDAEQNLPRNCSRKGETMSKPPMKCMDTILEEEEQREVEEPPSQMQRSPLKRKGSSHELNVHVYSYQRQKIEAASAASQAPNAAHDGLHHRKRTLCKPGGDKQLDELLQEVLTLQDKPNEVLLQDEENEQQRMERLGKSNVDKWLQKLLLSPVKQLPDDLHEGGHGGKERHIWDEQCVVVPKHNKAATISTVIAGERAKKGFGGFFRRMGFRHDAKKLRLLKERNERALIEVQDEENYEGQAIGSGKEGSNNANQPHDIAVRHGKTIVVQDGIEHNCELDSESEQSKISKATSARPDGLDVNCSDENYTTPSELLFVQRMRELREEERARRCKRMSDQSNTERLADEVGTQVASHYVDHADKLQKTAKQVIPPFIDRMTRSYSMRATSSGGRWILHTRKGSDVFPSTMEGEALGEEVEIVLKPSSSFRKENAISESHVLDSGSGMHGNNGNMGFKSSLKTCTKAWKRAVSKRSANH
ncbi:hypothetical protein GOP47_0017310 [Adiantum capillus-veneris]|uniref:Uncharacterized protein n=1 Tax=Adiantum capillus-veneris TaxID=13818 RepID=A0A9D4UFJ7_ADICA|nr:hypothetical protein GOP47_0017310 [Adiantum capillus-veneris]